MDDNEVIHEGPGTAFFSAPIRPNTSRGVLNPNRWYSQEELDKEAPKPKKNSKEDTTETSEGEEADED